MPHTASRPALGAAAALSALAGYVDGIAFIFLGGYFVSFMSGNTTAGSVDIVRGGDWAIAFLLVVGFVVGVIAGTIVTRTRAAAWVLALVTVLLLAGTLLTEVGATAVIPSVIIAAGMGAVNTAFARDGQPALGLTYMTGALVSMAQELVSAFTGGSRTAWIRHLVLWLAIAIGAVAGAAAYGWLGIRSLWIAVVVAAVAAVVALMRARR